MDNGPHREKIKGFLTALERDIRGQNHVLKILAAHILRSEQGLTEHGLPRGGFMFVGPTGVGKTEVTKLLTAYLYGADALARFDMSEYMLRETVEEFKRRVCLLVREGKRVFLCDEIEKADLDIMNLFLQILSAARITDAKGETLDLSECYFILTSNIGAADAMQSRTRNMVSFERTIRTKVLQELKKPELLGRFEEAGAVIVFYPLDAAAQREVADVATRKIVARMAEHGHRIRLDTRALEFVMRNGFHPQYGARPLQGLLRREVEGAVARVAIDGKTAVGVITTKDDRSGLELRLE